MRTLSLIAVAVFLLCTQQAIANDAPIAPKTVNSLEMLSHAAGLPAEFREHFFGVPLTVRVERNRQFLGDAQIIIGADESIRLLDFTDISESIITPQERQRWRDYLRQPRRLGECLDTCPLDLLVMHYSLENSVLSLLTANGERDAEVPRYLVTPQDGSHGAILRNSLNLVGGQGQELYGRYAIEARGSIGNWTTFSSAQLDQSSAVGVQPRYALNNLYAERELHDHFVRAGYFYPDARGVMRQPRSPGGRDDSTLGVMWGSSDTLSVKSATASTYPVYVTANRQGMVEIYRSGNLLNTQPVQPGLQTIDTTVLPSGIYDIELRVVEDGVITARSIAQIYKPGNWGNPDQRWRYNLFLGKRSALFDNGADDDEDGLSAGVSVNYLLHPRAIVGLAAQQSGDQNIFGSSLDLNLADWANLYANLYQASKTGTGVDTQAVFNLKGGSVVLSHSRSWLDNRDDVRMSNAVTRYRGTSVNSAISVYKTLNQHSSASVRVSHSSGANNGVGLDLGINHRHQLFGNDAMWRVSMFQRPESVISGSTSSTASNNNTRNRGVDVTLNWSFGSDGRRLSASLGTRSASNGGRDQYAGVGYGQSFSQGTVRDFSANASADRYGVNLSGMGSFENRFVQGNAHLQRSSLNGALSGGINLDSTVAIGGGRIAASGEYLGNVDAGLIVDIESDIDNIELRADDSQGSSTKLRPGRNFVPVGAYQSGSVQFDLAYDAHDAVAIFPPTTAYHLNKGGVEYRQIRVMHTVTVLGRLVDGAGQPLKGMQVVNHASSGFSEADGFFSLDMSVKTPTLEVRQQDHLLCQLTIDKSAYRQEGDLLMLGNIPCTGAALLALSQQGKDKE